MLRRYRAWLRPSAAFSDEERRPFFTQGIVVLDANVLLSLYEYTAPARDQVLSALERVKEQLWLPYQVGLEFVRGRHRVIASRTSALHKAPDEVNRGLNEAKQALLRASNFVKQLLMRYAQDEAAVEELNRQINQESIDGRFREWSESLFQEVEKLKTQQDILLSSVASGDPVLPRVAALYGDRVGEQPDPEQLRRRVEDAVNYRFPNRIPPGFSDRGKLTPLQAVGDFLLWEEVIEHVSGVAGPRRVLLISSDLKSDWYEPEEPGRGPRPWPMLSDELRLRAESDLCIETPRQFFQGVKQYLDVEIAEATYDEIDRAAEEIDRVAEVLSRPQDVAEAVTEDNALDREPPPGLVLLSYRCAGLSTAAVFSAEESRMYRMFHWWLIGVTVQLGRRKPEDGEPLVELRAATRSTGPLRPDWQRGTVLRVGEWPYRTSSWIAPWFVQLLDTTAESDRRLLQRLAAQQVDWAGAE